LKIEPSFRKISTGVQAFSSESKFLVRAVGSIFILHLHNSAVAK